MTLIAGDQRKECCKQPENLKRHEERPDLVVNKCQVCGCRHFELTVDPGKLGLRGTSL